MRTTKLLLAGMLAAPFTLFAQNFKIEGKFTKLDSVAKVYLYDGERLDSADVTNGAFSFAGTTENPKKGLIFVAPKGQPPVNVNQPWMRFSYKDNRPFFIEEGNTVLTGTDSLLTSKVGGSAITADFDELQKQLKGSEKAKSDWEKLARSTPADYQTEEFATKMKADRAKIDADRAAIEKSFIKSHPDSYMSIYTLHTAYDPFSSESNFEDGKALYEGLSFRIKETSLAKEYAAKLTTKASLGK